MKENGIGQQGRLKDMWRRYGVRGFAISRSKAALIKNDILDNKAGEISFQDPIYAYWLKTEYFTK